MTPSSAVLIVTPDYGDDDTTYGANDEQAYAEYESNNSACPAGDFAVITGDRTVTRNGSSQVTDVYLALSDQDFSFEAP